MEKVIKSVDTILQTVATECGAASSNEDSALTAYQSAAKFQTQVGDLSVTVEIKVTVEPAAPF